jgi:hypothetical protein
LEQAAGGNNTNNDNNNSNTTTTTTTTNNNNNNPTRPSPTTTDLNQTTTNTHQTDHSDAVHDIICTLEREAEKDDGFFDGDDTDPFLLDTDESPPGPNSTSPTNHGLEIDSGDGNQVKQTMIDGEDGVVEALVVDGVAAQEKLKTNLTNTLKQRLPIAIPNQNPP